MPKAGLPYVPSADEQVKFLLYIQRVLAEGQFTATYKFALILAIANLCVESRDQQDGAFELEAGDLAEQFIKIYWRQTIPFRGAELKHIARNQAAIINQIKNARIQVNGSLPGLRSPCVTKWN